MFKSKIKEVKDIEGNAKTQIGLEVKLPGCDEFVPLGKSQYKRIYKDDIGPRFLILLDECAELLEPSGGKSTEAKEEDALKAEMEMLIKSITQLGRSSGIHMILAPLRLSTIIPTTKGYKTMKTIEVGDIVFDCNNKPTKVIGVAPIKMSEEMYEISLTNSNNAFVSEDTTITIGSDYEHRFPVVVKDKFGTVIKGVCGENGICTTKEIFDLTQNRYNVYIKGDTSGDSENLWLVESIINTPNELVRCIEVESDEHLFLVTDREIEEWKENPSEEGYRYSKFTLCTHNTQRNDCRIISGQIQNNPLSIQTIVRVLRK